MVEVLLTVADEPTHVGLRNLEGQLKQELRYFKDPSTMVRSIWTPQHITIEEDDKPIGSTSDKYDVKVMPLSSNFCEEFCRLGLESATEWIKTHV